MYRLEPTTVWTARRVTGRTRRGDGERAARRCCGGCRFAEERFDFAGAAFRAISRLASANEQFEIAGATRAAKFKERHDTAFGVRSRTRLLIRNCESSTSSANGPDSLRRQDRT